MDEVLITAYVKEDKEPYVLYLEAVPWANLPSLLTPTT